jgi:hypothetical protein
MRRVRARRRSAHAVTPIVRSQFTRSDRRLVLAGRLSVIRRSQGDHSDEQGEEPARVHELDRGEVDDPTATSVLCCTTLYELPRQLGTLAADTVLWAGSFGAHGVERRMSIRVWQSTDVGQTWHYLSTAYQAQNIGGLWEPSFEVDAAGRLVMQFSNETMQPAYSQFLSETESSDGGRTWSTPTPTVRSDNPAFRPGMATVQELPDRTFVMTYEVCGARADSVARSTCAHCRTAGRGAIRTTWVRSRPMARTHCRVDARRAGRHGLWW